MKKNDLFSEYLQRKNESELVKQALTDKSYKKVANKDIPVNTDLATYGDAVIKLAYCEILLGKRNKLTEVKSQYESDEFLVTKVARHYNLLKYIDKDDDNNRPNDYEYEKHQSKNRNKCKYIATAVEAMICAIYKENNYDLKPIVELLDNWMKF